MALDACETLRQWWAKWEETGSDVVLASDAQIEALERRYSIVLLDDFRLYLQTLCPATGGRNDGAYEWWGLDRIKSISDAYAKFGGYPNFEGNSAIAVKAGQYLFFVDYIDRLYCWAISCTDDENHGRVALVEGPPLEFFVADSFSEFVERHCDERYSEGCPSLRGGIRE